MSGHGHGHGMRGHGMQGHGTQGHGGHVHGHEPHDAPLGTAAERWNARYAERERIWSGRPNAALVAEVGRLQAAGLEPARALDLGAGEGADAEWLAAEGWTVTAVDVSDIAIGRARERAPQVDWVVADLVTWEPTGWYELVSACFLHSFDADFDRQAILARAAAHVAPGGRLLVVAHAAPPPWSTHHHELPGLDEELAGLPSDGWDVEVAEERDRETVGPGGEPAVLRDLVVVLRRA